MFHGKRYDNFLTFTVVTLSHLDDSCCKQLVIWLIEALCILEGKGLRDATICDVKVVDVGHLFIVLDVKDIYIMEGVAYDLALAAIILEKNVLLLNCFCLFEL